MKHLWHQLLERLTLRKVYSIAFPCDQTIELWTGEWPQSKKPVYTFLGREAWRTTSRGQADEVVCMIIKSGHPDPMVSNAQWEFLLNREDWTW